MSFLKTIKTQLGISSTPANNFVLDASAANGTMKVSRGNVEGTTQDVITVDAAGKVAFPQNAQTWQDLAVPSTRNLGVTYTNDTGQSIQVNVSAVSTSVGTINALINGTITLRGSMVSTAGNRASIMFTVPSGATYQVDLIATASAIFWSELR